MPHGLLRFPFGKCRVCEDTATGVHYGVATCEGCKGFFKRSLLRQHKYKCFFGGECMISPKDRNRCKACRFKRCLQSGMSLDGIKMGRIPKYVKEHALGAATAAVSSADYSDSVVNITGKSPPDGQSSYEEPTRPQSATFPRVSLLNPAVEDEVRVTKPAGTFEVHAQQQTQTQVFAHVSSSIFHCPDQPLRSSSTANRTTSHSLFRENTILPSSPGCLNLIDQQSQMVCRAQTQSRSVDVVTGDNAILPHSLNSYGSQTPSVCGKEIIGELMHQVLQPPSHVAEERIDQVVNSLVASSQKDNQMNSANRTLTSRVPMATSQGMSPAISHQPCLTNLMCAATSSASKHWTSDISQESFSSCGLGNNPGSSHCVSGPQQSDIPLELATKGADCHKRANAFDDEFDMNVSQFLDYNYNELENRTRLSSWENLSHTNTACNQVASGVESSSHCEIFSSAPQSHTPESKMVLFRNLYIDQARHQAPPSAITHSQNSALVDGSGEGHTGQQDMMSLLRCPGFEVALSKMKERFWYHYAHLFFYRKRMSLRLQGIKMPNEELEVKEENKAQMWSLLLNSVTETNERIVGFSASVPGFNKLPTSDQQKLAKHAYFPLWMITHHTFLRKNGESHLMFTNGTRYPREWMDVILPQSLIFEMFEVANAFTDLQLSDDEMVYLCAIAVTNQDGVVLEDKENAKKLHDHLIDVFAEEVTKNHTNSGRLLINMFTDVLPKLKILNENQDKVIGNFKVPKPNDT